MKFFLITARGFQWEWGSQKWGFLIVVKATGYHWHLVLGMERDWGAKCLKMRKIVLHKEDLISLLTETFQKKFCSLMAVRCLSIT